VIKRSRRWKKVKSVMAELYRLDDLQAALDKKKKGETLSEKQTMKRMEGSLRIR